MATNTDEVIQSQRTGEIVSVEPRKLRSDATVNIPQTLLEELDINPEDGHEPTVCGYSNGVVELRFDT